MTRDASYCDIVLLVYDQTEYTRKCIRSILTHTRHPFRLIIVDNGSVLLETKQLLEQVQKEEPQRVRVIRNEINQGYVKAVNRGLDETAADYVVVMSNDTVVYPGWLTEMVRTACAKENIGIVNPVWDCAGDSSVERDAFFKKFVLPHSGEWIETDWARGFCYLTKRAVIDHIGGLDMDFAPAYYDDWDYSMRAIREGYCCVKALGAFVFHYKNITYAQSGFGQDTSSLLTEKGRIFYERWGRPLNILWCSVGSVPNEDTIRALLCGQNRLRIVTGKQLRIMHTNCWSLRTAPWAVRWAVLVDMANNYRHSRYKHYHLVVADSEIRDFLKIFPGIGRAYEFHALSDGDVDLLAKVSCLKFHRENKNEKK